MKARSPIRGKEVGQIVFLLGDFILATAQGNTLMLAFLHPLWASFFAETASEA